MKALVQHTYGPPESLTVADIDTPAPGPGEVLVQVAAAGLGADVWHLTTGLPYPVRLVAGLRRPRQTIAGLDLAGHVTAIGEDVHDLAVGDRVFGTGLGALAETARARADKLALLPDNVGFEAAAATPISGATALQALRDKAEVQAGQRVAVLGAGGAVGSFAVQIAKILGAEVTGVCGPAKTDLVADLGADHVVDYTRSDFATGAPFDAIIDTAGHRPLRVLHRALTPRGTAVIVGSETGGRWLGGVDRQLRAALLSPFTTRRLGSLIAAEDRAELETLAGYLAEGRLHPLTTPAEGLEAAPEALQHWKKGTTIGRTVVAVD